MSNVFVQIFNWFKHIVVRPGIQDFLKKWEFLALHVVQDVIVSNPGTAFKDLTSNVFQKLEEAITKEAGTVPGNWITILYSLAFEAFKATQSSGQ